MRFAIPSAIPFHWPMRRWLVRSLKITLLLTALLAVLFALDQSINREDIARARQERFREKIYSCILPGFKLRDASLDEILSSLQSQAQKAGWRGELRFAVLSEAEAKKRFHRRLEIVSRWQWEPSPKLIPDLEPLPEAPDASSQDIDPKSSALPARITISLSAISLMEACREVFSMADYGMRVGDGVVELAPHIGDGTCDPFVQRAFRMRPFVKEFMPAEARLPNGHFDVRVPLHRDLLSFFEGTSNPIPAGSIVASLGGISFYEGTSADYDPKSGTLVLVNTQAQAELLDPPSSGSHDSIAHLVHAWFESLFHPSTPKPQTSPNPLAPPTAITPSIPGLNPIPGTGTELPPPSERRP